MKQVLSISFLLLFVSCNYNSGYDYLKEKPKPINYEVVSKSDFLLPENINFRIDSLHRQLNFLFALKNLKINYPINKQYNDTLYKTAFVFEFYNNGKIIESDYNYFKNTLCWKIDSLNTSKKLHVVSDTVNLKQGCSIAFKLPLYAFHQLKKGKQTIELKIHQEYWVDDLYIQGERGTQNHIHISEKKILLYASVKFEIIVPAIFKTNIIGYGLELRNDSTFSPVGMDNTIWNSSYPDIYWTIFYPTDYPYCQTPYQTSTDTYTGKDTFTLYHYYFNDSIGIGVYDHDNLSRDDAMGYAVEKIYASKKAMFKRFSFDAIKTFECMVKQEGVCN